MAEYAVVVPDPDVASVRMMETSLGQVTHLVAQVEAAQEERTNQFTEDIETSIASLRTASDELRAESEDKMLFDGGTDMIEALGKLDYLDSSFQALKTDSERYAYYQEILKVPVTRCASLQQHVLTCPCARDKHAPAHARTATPSPPLTPLHSRGTGLTASAQV